MKTDVHSSEEDYYEDVIQKLYKPAKKTTVAEVITQELPFEVEPAKEPEPAVVPEPEPEPESEPEEETNEPTMVNKWRSWLNTIVKDVTE